MHVQKKATFRCSNDASNFNDSAKLSAFTGSSEPSFFPPRNPCVRACVRASASPSLLNEDSLSCSTAQVQMKVFSLTGLGCACAKWPTQAHSGCWRHTRWILSNDVTVASDLVLIVYCLMLMSWNSRTRPESSHTTEELDETGDVLCFHLSLGWGNHPFPVSVTKYARFTLRTRVIVLLIH